MRRVNKDQKVRIGITLNGRKMSAETEPRMLLQIKQAASPALSELWPSIS